MKCLICNDGRDYKKLSRHLLETHQITSKDYFDKFLKKEDVGRCRKCGKSTNFINIIKGYHEFCCKLCCNSCEDFKSRKKETLIAKYGVDNYTKTSEFKEKRKTTCLKKYGVEHHFKSQLFKDQRAETCIKKYGTSTPFFKDRYVETSLERYGVDHPWKNKDIQRKKESTLLERYGVKNSYQVLEFVEKSLKTRLTKLLSKSKAILAALNLEPLDTLKSVTLLSKHRCLKCNTEFQTSLAYLNQGYGRCPTCFPRSNTSVGEKEILEFITASKLLTESNVRSIIAPKELDIYIPSKGIAIEYNGLYWHSESCRGHRTEENRHLNKLNMCQEKDINLIQIFEDEWLQHQGIVKARLKQILGVNDSRKVHARCCTVKEIPSNIKNEFLNNYHLQGPDNSPISLGAFYSEQLVAVMTFNHGSLAKGVRKTNDLTWELNRYCCNDNYHVPGIASKLLSYFKKNYEWSQIFSYADRRWSTGNMYYKLGFSLEKETKPNYWYVKGMKRIHRFALRKRPDEPKDIPEWLLRAQEGYTRVWDCGNLKFVMKNET